MRPATLGWSQVAVAFLQAVLCIGIAVLEWVEAPWGGWSALAIVWSLTWAVLVGFWWQDMTRMFRVASALMVFVGAFASFSFAAEFVPGEPYRDFFATGNFFAVLALGPLLLFVAFHTRRAWRRTGVLVAGVGVAMFLPVVLATFDVADTGFWLALAMFLPGAVGASMLILDARQSLSQAGA